MIAAGRFKKECEGIPPSRPTRAAVLGVGFTLNGNRFIESDELFGESATLTIRHQGEEYRLEKTRNGKLILKK